MTIAQLTYWAIGLKVGATILAVLVLFIVLSVKRKRDRKRQDMVDDAVLRRHPRS